MKIIYNLWLCCVHVFVFICGSDCHFVIDGLNVCPIFVSLYPPLHCINGGAVDILLVFILSLLIVGVT